MTYFEKRLAEIKASAPQVVSRAKKSTVGISREKTRHGVYVYYYRVGKGKRYRLPDPSKVDASTFNLALAAAKRGESAPRYSPPPIVKRTSRSRLGYVYFLRMGGSVKIGFSSNAGKRLRSIQTSCPERAQFVALIPGDEATESYFHLHFAAHRLSGEWFRIDGNLETFLSAAPPILQDAEESDAS